MSVKKNPIKDRTSLLSFFLFRAVKAESYGQFDLICCPLNKPTII